MEGAKYVPGRENKVAYVALNWFSPQSFDVGSIILQLE